MAIQSRNKVSIAFSMSSMTDIIFLLLIFFMVTSTLITPNALDVVLPKSGARPQVQPNISVTITEDLVFAVEKQIVEFGDLERILQQRLANTEEPTIALHAEKSVPINWVVKVMNIAKNNKYRLVLATSPE